MWHSIFKFVLLTTACWLLSVSAAMAERQVGTLTLTPMVGYHVIDGAMNLEDSPVFGVSLGYNVSPRWALEADLRYTPTEIDTVSSNDLDIWTFSLGGLYDLLPNADFKPYLSIGAGLMVYKRDGTSDNDEDAFGYYGVGIKHALSESIDLRFDARHILDYRSNSGDTFDDGSDWGNHLQAMVGFTYQFGSAPVAAKPLPAAVTMAVAMEEPSAPVDNDRDGVFNAQDKCPGTAPAVRVNKDGCPADTDGDGVDDYKDACIGTPANTDVDQHGCTKGGEAFPSLRLNILFGIDEDQVTPFHAGELGKAAAFIAKYPGHQIVVEGHTDDQGSAEYNRSLSQRRADHVRQALISQYGVSADHISAVGYGELQPLTGNATNEERMQNRRVEISIQP